MNNDKAIEKLAGILADYETEVSVGIYAITAYEKLAAAILAEVQANPTEYVKVKDIVWDWIGTTHAFGGGCELLLTKFTAPKDRRMWRLALRDRSKGFIWYEESELEAAQAAAQAYYDKRVKECLV